MRQHDTRTPAFTARVLQAGLSLVELMVAMTISLLILGALVALFSNTSRSNPVARPRWSRGPTPALPNIKAVIS